MSASIVMVRARLHRLRAVKVLRSGKTLKLRVAPAKVTFADFGPGGRAEFWWLHRAWPADKVRP